ncbi:MAG: 30S ribosomal protein S8 [Fuerstiella sp.]|nr:30S ribosomal protein S8 [Fuerstiella sp.]
MMTDPIADFLTRIRNAVRVERPFVEMPLSKMKMHLAAVLHREGYVWDSEVVEGEPVSTLRVNLKYGPNGEHLIEHIERLSKPGRRVYVGVSELKDVRQGTGISVLSTPKGLLSNREARQQGVGGELLCQLW